LAVDFAICTYLPTAALARAASEALADGFAVRAASTADELATAIADDLDAIDCLVVQDESEVRALLDRLAASGQVLPAAIVAEARPDPPLYHRGEVCLAPEQLDRLPEVVYRALKQFLHQVARGQLAAPPAIADTLARKQERLHLKLQERLGYLGVYYKRNPQDFFRHQTPEEKQAFLRDLREQYRSLLLKYFSKDANVNPAIDRFVNSAFFADLSVSQIMEIHMDLMEQFSQQLRLEGRSDEVLLDYRLTLIDVVAHLCEMYRRSIPREDTPNP